MKKRRRPYYARHFLFGWTFGYPGGRTTTLLLPFRRRLQITWNTPMRPDS